MRQTGNRIDYKGLLSQNPQELRLPAGKTIAERSHVPLTKRLVMAGAFKSAKTGLIVDPQTKIIEHINSCTPIDFHVNHHPELG